MEKKTKILMALVLVGVTIIGFVIFGRAELFQGRFSIPQKYTKAWFKYKGKIVSPVASRVVSVVASPVSSLVASKVTSRGGISKVSSKVTSFVASPVASAVASAVTVPATSAASTNMEALQQLTPEVLKNAARQDMMERPVRYKLSQEERGKIIKMYEQSRKMKR
jgi:uncharacterized membrane protein